MLFCGLRLLIVMEIKLFQGLFGGQLTKITLNLFSFWDGLYYNNLDTIEILLRCVIVGENYYWK